VSSGVDVIGDIAIVRLAEFSSKEKRTISGALLGEMKNVRVILEQEGGIEGEFRLRKLRHLAGEKRTLTVHRENGCAFRVDVARCYFSPRLSTERLKIAQSVGRREKVLNMFAGVGPFSIPIARLAGAEVTSCEINGYAAKLHVENNKLNKVESLVRVVRGDAGDLASESGKKFDRILMPLPERADRFLPAALEASKMGATIHYYRHVLGRNEAEASRALHEELGELLPKRARCRIRRVRDVGPRWLEMAADIRLPS
jgi:tRNA (guanine37-N1)-methyltransferase